MKPHPELLTAKELMERIGLRKSQFHVLRKRKKFDHLMTSRPLGFRKYSRALVDRYVSGQSTVTLGGGRRRTA